MVIPVGMVKGILFACIPYAVWRDNPLPNIIGGFALAIGLAIALEYLLVYLPNMRKHRLLEIMRSKAYEEDLEKALREMGLLNMMQKFWFADRFKKQTSQ